MKSLFHHPLRFLVGLIVAMAGLAHAQPNPPTVATLPASAVGPTNATLNGIGNPSDFLTFGFFHWGTTTNYGNVTPAQSLGSGGSNTNFSQVVNGLLPGATYHFRAVVSNSFDVVFGTNQSFTTPLFSPAVMNMAGNYWGTAGWGDYDNDGRLDVVLTGVSGPSVWRNTGAGFTNLNVAFPGLSNNGTPTPWGDYDNDGKLDILLINDNNAPDFQVWRNSGDSFTNANANLPGFGGAGVWADFDSDGLLDIMTVRVSPSPVTERGLFCNTGSSLINNHFMNVNGVTIPGPATLSCLRCGDWDNDGLMDLYVGGRYDNLDAFAHSPLWRNTGNGFTNVIVTPLFDLQNFAGAWGDYDNDGLLDIVVTGHNSSSAAVTVLLRNTGSGFTNVNAGFPGVVGGSVAWGDYDNDGRLDLLLTGGTSFNAFPTNLLTQVWRNTGNGFSNINAGLPGLGLSAVGWGDYDNDGRLDILLVGGTNFNANAGIIGSPRTQIWRNNTPLANTPPTAPTGLAETVNGNAVIFSWNSATDAQTPASGLTYNLRVGTTPGGSDLVGPMAASSGLRRLPEMGNAQLAHSRTILGLPLGKTIYWSVQAVDTAFAGSPFAPEHSATFNTVPTPPNGVPIAGDTNGDGIVSQSELNVVLASYFPNSPFLQMTNVAGLGGTNVTFALSNSTAGAFSVEYTTNLSNWFLLGPATPRYLFIDTNAPAIPQRYYRLRWP